MLLLEVEQTEKPVCHFGSFFEISNCQIVLVVSLFLQFQYLFYIQKALATMVEFCVVGEFCCLQE